MEYFRNFEQARTGNFFITRDGWFKPVYELTDGQFVYGRLSYKGVFKRYAIIESTAGVYTIKRQSLFSRIMLLNQNEDDNIGELIPATWKRDITIKLNTGFEATYLFKKLFSRAYTLTNDLYGDILDIKQVPFGIKKPFEINIITANKQPNTPDIPLLSLIGVHFILLRQARAAAAH